MTVITIGDNEWGGNALRNTWGAGAPNVAAIVAGCAAHAAR